MLLPSPSLAKAFQSQRLGRDGFTPTPSKALCHWATQLHKYSATFLEEQLQKILNTHVPSAFGCFVTFNRSTSYHNNQENDPQQQGTKVVLNSIRP